MNRAEYDIHAMSLRRLWGWFEINEKSMTRDVVRLMAVRRGVTPIVDDLLKRRSSPKVAVARVARALHDRSSGARLDIPRGAGRSPGRCDFEDLPDLLR